MNVLKDRPLYPAVFVYTRKAFGEKDDGPSGSYDLKRDYICKSDI